MISSPKKRVHQLIVFLIFLSGNFVSGQRGNTIFEGFYEGMTKEQVLTEYENNDSKYSKVFFTEGIDWKIAINGFSYNEYNLLYGIDLIPITQQNNQSSYDYTKNCLNAAKDVINNQGFQIFYKPDHWNDPSKFNSFWENRRFAPIFPKRIRKNPKKKSRRFAPFSQKELFLNSFWENFPKKKHCHCTSPV